MKLCSKDSKSDLIKRIVIQSLWILFLIVMEIKVLSTNAPYYLSDIHYISSLILLVSIIYSINDCISSYKAENYELVLEEEYFTYRTFFTKYTKQYDQIRSMKIARYVVKTSLVEYGHIDWLKIKLKGINKIYISLDSITDTQYEELKKFLLNKTGITIKEIN